MSEFLDNLFQFQLPGDICKQRRYPPRTAPAEKGTSSPSTGVTWPATRRPTNSPDYFLPDPTLALAVPRTFLVLFFLSFFCFLLTLALGSMTP